MAAAVLLCSTQEKERRDSTDLLTDLIYSKFERVRYRAVISIIMRTLDYKISNYECHAYLNILNARMKIERVTVVRKKMNEAVAAIENSFNRKTYY